MKHHIHPLGLICIYSRNTGGPPDSEVKLNMRKIRKKYDLKADPGLDPLDQSLALWSEILAYAANLLPFFSEERPKELLRLYLHKRYMDTMYRHARKERESKQIRPTNQIALRHAEPYKMISHSQPRLPSRSRPLSPSTDHGFSDSTWQPELDAQSSSPKDKPSTPMTKFKPASIASSSRMPVAVSSPQVSKITSPHVLPQAPPTQPAHASISLHDFLFRLDPLKGYLFEVLRQNGITTTARFARIAKQDENERKRDIAELMEYVEEDLVDALHSAKSI